MRQIAIIGSGPAGYYTAEAAQKQWGDDVRVDIFDCLPVPYGLIRFGVAPDHQSIKGVYRRYETTSLSDNVRFVGNVTVGRDVTIGELQELYDAVVLATGAPHDKKTGIPGEDLPNVFGSAAFVGWYNGHPSFAALDPFRGADIESACDAAWRFLEDEKPAPSAGDLARKRAKLIDRTRVLVTGLRAVSKLSDLTADAVRCGGHAVP